MADVYVAIIIFHVRIREFHTTLFANGKFKDLKRWTIKLMFFSSDKFTRELQFTTLLGVVRVWTGINFVIGKKKSSVTYADWLPRPSFVISENGWI